MCYLKHIVKIPVVNPNKLINTYIVVSFVIYASAIISNAMPIPNNIPMNIIDINLELDRQNANNSENSKDPKNMTQYTPAQVGFNSILLRIYKMR